VEEFLAERRHTHTGLFSRKALGPILAWLASQGAIPVEAARRPVVADPPELVAFEEYLLSERRLASSTVAASMARARRFVAGYVPAGGLVELSAADVTRALLDEGATRKPVSVKTYGYTLRMMLRFFFITGVTGHDLSAATLVVRSPQPSRLPVGVTRRRWPRCWPPVTVRRSWADAITRSSCFSRGSGCARLRLPGSGWTTSTGITARSWCEGRETVTKGYHCRTRSASRSWPICVVRGLLTLTSGRCSQPRGLRSAR
jgi:hypothetical protein